MKALIAMSGGVDSSVAALLTKEQGYECIGCTMRLYTGRENDRMAESGCCSLSDTEDAGSVAAGLGIKYYVFNMEDAFREKVIRRFIDGYECGITPNPCIDCNRFLKFDLLYKRAEILGCEKIVTGHYARTENRDGRYYLMKARDPQKDQSYVLYHMTQDQLAHTEFPLGSLFKRQVREIAGKYGFINAEKPDSQDICFVPDGDYAAFIQRMTGRKYPEGDFTDSAGNILGRHKGIIRYTVGQRKGLGVPAKEPLYVLEIRRDENRVILGPNSRRYIRNVYVTDVNWIISIDGRREISCSVRLRYHQAEQPATVVPVGKDAAKVIFRQLQQAAPPGQAAVFYDGDYVLGGGVITQEQTY